MKQQKKVEKFIIAPSTHLFLGVTVTKDTDIEDELKTEQGTIKQTIKDLKLTTIINRETTDVVKTIEKSTLIQDLSEGMCLIWGEDTGYIIPPYKMKKVDEAIEDLAAIKDV